MGIALKEIKAKAPATKRGAELVVSAKVKRRPASSDGTGRIVLSTKLEGYSVTPNEIPVTMPEGASEHTVEFKVTINGPSGKATLIIDGSAMFERSFAVYVED
jgi:hypothetical protein